MTDPFRCPARVKSSSPHSGSESALAPTLTRHTTAEEDAHGSGRVAQSKQFPEKPERFRPRAWRVRSQLSWAPSCVRRALSSFDMHSRRSRPRTTVERRYRGWGPASVIRSSRAAALAMTALVSMLASFAPMHWCIPCPSAACLGPLRAMSSRAASLNAASSRFADPVSRITPSPAVPVDLVDQILHRREFATSARPEREYCALLRGFDYLMIPRETRPGVPDGCDADPPGASAGATRGAVAAASGATPQSPTERTNPADWRPITTVIGRQNRRLAMRCAGAGVSTERTRAAGAAAGRAWLRWPAGRRQACEFSRARAQGPAGSDSSHLSLVPST